MTLEKSKLELALKTAREKLEKEKMTPKKRLGEAANYNDVDRVPIAVPVFAGHLAAISGLKLIELTNDPKKLAYANFVAESRYGFDYMAANAVCDPYNITPEALGCKLKYYEESYPVIVDYVIKDPKDLDKLSFPDFRKDGRFPYVMETTKLISDGMGDLVSVGPDIPAPFSLACCLRSFPKFALDMMRDKEFAHRLLTFCTELTVECIKTCAEFGADVITIPDAWAVFPNVSEELYFEFVHPYGTEVIKKSPKFPGGICWLAKEVGIARYTKDPYQFYDKLMESGTALLPVYAPDNATLDLARLKAIAKKHGKSMSAMVHYNTVKYGPFDKIRKETVDLIRRGAPGNGFDIGINAVESDTPPENVDFYVELVKREGKYPIEA